MFTCTGVSFAHGSNDGQKGMGLIMLILVGIIPATFALKPDSSASEIEALRQDLSNAALYCKAHDGSLGDQQLPPRDAVTIISEYMHNPQNAAPVLFQAIWTMVDESQRQLVGVNSLANIPVKERGALRSNLYLLSTSSAKLVKNHQLDSSSAEKNAKSLTNSINALTNYIPVWVKVAVAFALGLGTMVGWKRIVVTVGEKIGKSHLTYGQGAAAELVAMLTISMADLLGLPVSTTHVLSSGIAGTMAANGSGLQMQTVRNILLAWVLTLPICVFLGASLFALGLNLILRLGIG